MAVGFSHSSDGAYTNNKNFLKRKIILKKNMSNKKNSTKESKIKKEKDVDRATKKMVKYIFQHLVWCGVVNGQVFKAQNLCGVRNYLAFEYVLIEFVEANHILLKKNPFQKYLQIPNNHINLCSNSQWLLYINRNQRLVLKISNIYLNAKQKSFCILKSFNTNISHQLFD